MPGFTGPNELCSPRTLTETTRSPNASGRTVCKSTVPDRPWPISDALVVLCTTTAPINSDGYWSNSTPRLSPVLTCSRPLSSVVPKLSGKPRILMLVARPATRWAVRPGSLARDSAILMSGSLPMSSAEMVSTMEVDSRLVSIAFSMPRRIPVTVTRSRSTASSALGCAVLSAVSAAVCANALVALNVIADTKATLSRLRLSFTISPPLPWLVFLVLPSPQWHRFGYVCEACASGCADRLRYVWQW